MTIPLPGTAHGKIEGNFVFLTKRIRIPRGAILAVQPSRDGEGTTVVTERGAMRVCEDYSALMYHLYGVNVKARREPARTGGKNKNQQIRSKNENREEFEKRGESQASSAW